MLRNITQYIRHNLKNSKAIMILMAVVMLICGAVPAFMQFSSMIERFGENFGISKVDYALRIQLNLTKLFDIADNYYSILLSLIAAVAGLVLPYILFYYFRKKNSADFFLSLPVTRTEAYIANFISGVLYYIIPLIATSAVTIIGLNIMGSWRFANASKLLFPTETTNGLFAMLGNNLTFFLLFFAIGTVAVLLAGNGINALAVYGTINFYPIVFLFLLLLSAEIFNNDIIDYADAILEEALHFTPIIRALTFSEYPSTVWTYVMGTVSAAAIAVLGCFICNIRPAESWSSAIIFKPLRLAMQYMYCFIVAFAGGLFFYFISDRSLINIIAGSIVGLIAAFMVLNIIFERDMKAFFRKPLRLLWSALIFVAIFVVIVIDVFGIFRYRKPSPDDIDSVQISLDHNIIRSNLYAINDDDALNKLTDKDEKAAAIELYTLLHEQTRNENYEYLFRDDGVPRNLTGLAYYDDMLLSYFGNSSRIEVRMIKNDKDIRPLRESYFKRTEEMYELYKTIYDSQSYTDPMVTVLENAEMVFVQPTTVSIRETNIPSKLGINDKGALENLRLALIEDYKNVTFEQLQDTTPYILELMYNVKDTYPTSEKTRVDVEFTQSAPVAIGEYSYPKYDFERNMSIVIPSCFVNTLEVLREICDLDELNRLTLEAHENIAKLIVEVYSDDEPAVITEVTDKDEINRILADRVSSISRSMIFPKRGVIVKALFTDEYIVEMYGEDYLEKYDDDRRIQDTMHIYFLKRTSNLY